MPGRLLAKMAAALKACELLHKCGNNNVITMLTFECN